MMYSSEFVFIHIPRTGGTALTSFFGSSEIISKDVHYYKHATAFQIKNLFEVMSADWKSVYKFTLYRNPVEIVISWYNHVITNFDILDIKKVTKEWFNYCHKIKSMSFDDFVDLELKKLVKKGGFLNHWCNTCDDVDILSFNESCKYLSKITGLNPDVEYKINTSNNHVKSVSSSVVNKIIDWCNLDKYS